MRPLARSLLATALAGVFLAGCAAGSTPAPSSTTTPTPAASPTPSATADPTPTPVPSTDGNGDEYVTGTESISVATPYTSTMVGDVTQLRGGILSITAAMNDPRVSGTGTFPFSADLYTKVGSEWGTYHLENAGGAWDGPCSGATWDEGASAMWSCWLVGSGAYKGFTYYRQFLGTEPGTSIRIDGIIYPGSAPKP